MNRRDLIRSLLAAPMIAVTNAANDGAKKPPSVHVAAAGNSPPAPFMSYETWATGIAKIDGKYYVERHVSGVNKDGAFYQRTEIGQEIVPGLVCTF